MQARLLTNLSLLALVIILMVTLWPSDAPEPAPAYTPLTSIDPAKVKTIHLTRSNRPDLLLQKSGADWQINSPVQIAANPFRVSSLLSLLNTHSISTVPSGKDTYGLTDIDKPVTLTFDNQVFRFGDINPFDQSRYLLHNGIIHLVDDNLYQQLLQDVTFFVDTHLLAVGTELDRIRLANLEIQYQDNHWSQIAGATSLPVSSVIAIAARWQQLEANRVTAATGSPVPADIFLHTTGGDQIMLTIISTTAELQLLRIDKGIVYHFPAQTAVDLGITLSKD
jgi:hypothetical protein